MTVVTAERSFDYVIVALKGLKLMISTSLWQPSLTECHLEKLPLTYNVVCRQSECNLQCLAAHCYPNVASHSRHAGECQKCAFQLA